MATVPYSSHEDIAAFSVVLDSLVGNNFDFQRVRFQCDVHPRHFLPDESKSHSESIIESFLIAAPDQACSLFNLLKIFEI